ncbi:MAG TPA: hypothetical protein VKC51_06080 [Lacunisphaera sp.]|nr:hypothetical protein [Lacunisphaera sp.]
MNYTKSAILAFFATVAFAHAQPVGNQVEVKPQGEYAKIDTSATIRDMTILAKGSDSEKDALVKKMKKNPGDYAPPVFMLMARRLYEKKDPEGAYLWFCFGRMRGRYDAARCADVSAREGISVMIMNVDPELRKYPMKMKPDDIVPFARKVVKLDSDTPFNYDHRWLNLHGLGAFTGDKQELSLPKAQWPDLLKKVRDDFLKGAEEMVAQLKNPKKE